MKKLTALKNGTKDTYELIHIENSIYIFITRFHDGSLKIEKINRGDYGRDDFDKIIENKSQVTTSTYELFLSTFHCTKISNHQFESDKYYTHLLQLREERLKQITSVKNGTTRALNLLRNHLEEQDFGYFNQIHLG